MILAFVWWIRLRLCETMINGFLKKIGRFWVSAKRYTFHVDTFRLESAILHIRIKWCSKNLSHRWNWKLPSHRILNQAFSKKKINVNEPHHLLDDSKQKSNWISFNIKYQKTGNSWVLFFWRLLASFLYLRLFSLFFLFERLHTTLGLFFSRRRLHDSRIELRVSMSRRTVGRRLHTYSGWNSSLVFNFLMDFEFYINLSCGEKKKKKKADETADESNPNDRSTSAFLRLSTREKKS